MLQRPFLPVYVCLLLLTPLPHLQAQTPDVRTPAAREWPIDVETAPRPLATITRTSGPVLVDGVIDEAAWETAQELTDFVQSKPRTGYPATERTVVKLLYDDDRIYIAALCYDSEPDKLVVPNLEQDFPSTDSDTFGFTFDTFYDRRNAFMILVNPRGAVKEAQNFDDSRLEDQAWEGVLVARTRIHEWGWSVEVAVPFTTLRFDPNRDEQVWGANFLRRIRRKNEESYWAPIDRRDFVHRMSRAGTLQGMRNVRAGRNLMVKPFALGARTTGSVVRDPGSTFDGGLDVKYGVTSQLTLDLTYRTDFSQVEVDQEQVNLTRFSLFFPEKRDFFVENSGIFSFGDISERNYRLGASLRDFTLFHSRRIGLEGGQIVPIVAGGRLSGKAGPVQLGLLNMQTESTDFSPAENFTVVRARRDFAGKADVGLMFVNRQATSDGSDLFNRSFGFDANVRPHPNMIVNSYLAATTEQGDPAGEQWAGRLTLGWRDRLWNITGFVKQVGDAFNPGVGFIRRRDMRQSYATIGIHPRPDLRWVQELNPFVEVDYTTNLDAVLETRFGVAGLDAQFVDGSRLEMEVRDSYERIEEPFAVGSGESVQPGEYDFKEATVAYRSSAGRRLSGRVGVTRGGFFGGERTSLDVTGLWRVDHHLALDVSVNHNDITLHGRDFTADVFGLRAKYGFSTTLFASAFFQHNADADQRIVNIRFDYIHAPLSDLFVVYTERRQDGAPLERIFSVKLTKLFSF